MSEKLESTPLAPTPPDERIVWLDMLRGFALLGILLINIVGFAWPLLYVELLQEDIPGNSVDHLTGQIVAWLVQGKFYTLFSLLFGISAFIFMMNADRRGVSPRILFLRRVLILLIIGLLHAVFLWWGDILVFYALCGLLLLLFYRCEPRTLLIWAGSLFAVFIVLMIALTGFMQLVESIEGNDDGSLKFGLIVQYQELRDLSFMNYQSGGWFDALSQRLTDWSYTLSNLFIAPFFILPIFLIGAYVVKSGWLNRLQSDGAALRNWMLWSLPIGGLFTILKEYSAANIERDMTTMYEAVQPVFAFVGDLGLAVFYACFLLVMSRAEHWRRLLSSLQWAGRMALTNYLVQSVVCGLLFYNFGFGLYGEIGIAGLSLIAIALFAIQAWYSRRWFTRYRYGPVEWLWRRLTYGKCSLAIQSGSSSAGREVKDE